MVFQRFYIAVLCTLLLIAPAAFAEGVDDKRAQFSADKKIVESPRPRLAPLSLPGGSTLTFVSPSQWVPLAKQLKKKLEDTHEHYTRLFGTIPPKKTTLRLIEAEEFYRNTGAPRWTNAMYYRGEITIPLELNEEIDIPNLFRSIKHEYTHAVINSLSAGRCPGWLDEGIAQWAEGEENPALQPALRSWLSHREPVPLRLLQGGFTRLNSKMVPPAYAQSLYATRSMINSFGLHRISKYLSELRRGNTKTSSFKRAFDISEHSFEKALGKSLKKWAHTHKDW